MFSPTHSSEPRSTPTSDYWANVPPRRGLQPRKHEQSFMFLRDEIKDLKDGIVSELERIMQRELDRNYNPLEQMKSWVAEAAAREVSSVREKPGKLFNKAMEVWPDADDLRLSIPVASLVDTQQVSLPKSIKHLEEPRISDSDAAIGSIEKSAMLDALDERASKVQTAEYDEKWRAADSLDLTISSYLLLNNLMMPGKTMLPKGSAKLSAQDERASELQTLEQADQLRVAEAGTRRAEDEMRDALQRVQAWCKEHGFQDVNTERRTFSGRKYPLHTAVKNQEVETVRLLIKCGAWKSSKDSKGQTAMELALKMKQAGRNDDVAQAVLDALE